MTDLCSLAADCPESLSDEELFAILNSDTTDAERSFPAEEHAQNGSRPRRRSGEFLHCLAARDSALCASEEPARTTDAFDPRAVSGEVPVKSGGAGLAPVRAFHELYRRYHRRVQTWCYRVVRNHAAAADLSQEVFLKAYRKKSSYRGDSKVSTWLFSVTRNHCLSALKRRIADPLAVSTPYPRLLSDVSAADQDAVIEAMEVYRRLYLIMERCLQPIEINILLLHYGHGLPLADITRALRLSNPSGAKRHIVNSRRKLRKAMEGTDALAVGLRRAWAA